MEGTTTLAELLLSDPEFLAWLEVNPDHRHERALFEQAQMSQDAGTRPGVGTASTRRRIARTRPISSGAW
jgi:hypothetical protein